LQKEIFEQPKAIADTLDQAIALDPLLFGEKADDVLHDIDRVLILACGTSYYAGCVARSWIESIAQVPTEVEIASESPLPDLGSGSGHAGGRGCRSRAETADTLCGPEAARSLGMTYTLAVCNVATSAIIARDPLQFLTRAGVEVGVASTKAFTTQLVALYLLATTLAKIKGRLNAAHERDVVRSLRHLPAAVQSVLALEPNVIAWSDVFARKENALFLGRGMHFPIAMEAPLKLKEISYIHAEAYPAGELKHGPLAAGDRRNAGGHGGPERPAAGEAEEQHDGGARPRRAIVRVRRRRHAHRAQRRRARDPAARALRRPVAAAARVAAAAARLSHPAVARGSDIASRGNLAKARRLLVASARAEWGWGASKSPQGDFSLLARVIRCPQRE